MDSDHKSMIYPINFGEKKLAFDINVDGLKAGDKIHVLDLTVNSNDPTWDGLNNFCFISQSVPLIINGTVYGYLSGTSYWGQNHNGGDQASAQFPDGLAVYNHEGHNTHELFIVMTKDYKGVGNQHIEIDSGDKNDLSLMNLEVGPAVFGNNKEINGTITATEHDGKVVSNKSFTFTRPTDDDLKINFVQPSAVGLGDGQPHAGYFSKIFTGDDVANRAHPYSGKDVNVQNNYEFAFHYDRTSNVLPNSDDFIVGKTYDANDGEQVDLGFELLDQNGYPLNGFRNVTAANTRLFKMPRKNLENGLSVQQLQARLDPNVSEVLSSYDSSTNSYNMVANITKDWIQQRTKPILSSKDALLRTYPAWWLNRLAPEDQKKALEYSMKWYSDIQYMPISVTFWNPALNPIDPNVKDKINGHIWSLNGPDSHHTDDATASQDNPNFLTLISGQAGIHVHYVDTDGNVLRQQDNTIDNANTTVDFVVSDIPGYTLDATNAKIPSGSETIEKTGTVTYPNDGQWKDVYVVYKPYLPNGSVTANYHYNH